MRKIKFRGKSTHSNEWVIGSLIKKRNGIAEWYIQDDNGLGSDVITETIGQYTGLMDKNGVEVYEGDILKGVTYSSNRLNNGVEAIGIVEYCIRWAAFEFKKISKDGRTIPNISECTVIGNIHDNPELINQQNNK